MEVLVYLVPMALMLGLLGLAGFLWSLHSGQYDDLDGAAWRAILDDEATPMPIDAANRTCPAQGTAQPAATLSNNAIRPSSSAAGRGGQPGMCRSTGSTLSTPPRTA